MVLIFWLIGKEGKVTNVDGFAVSGGIKWVRGEAL